MLSILGTLNETFSIAVSISSFFTLYRLSKASITSFIKISGADAPAVIPTDFMSSNGFKVIATDASAEMVKVAKIENNIDVIHQTFEDIKWINNFDGVWAHFSLLHATKRKFSNHLTALHRSLKSKGIFTIGMKLGEGERRDDIGRFYSYYSEPQLIALLEDNGFKTKEVSHGEDIGLDGKLAPWIIIRAHA